jgi:UDP-N-acetylmuramoylalanine--D-glutamate ligase
MIPLPYLHGETVGVLGLGRSGLASAAALSAGGAEVWAWDDSAETRSRAREAGVELHDLSRADWSRVKLLVLSPGIPHHYPQPHPTVARAVAGGCPVVSDIEMFALADLPARTLGVTGTNGKSTTCALTGHILSQAGRRTEVGGNIGTAVLALESLDADGFYVLELSSYQLETTFSLACEVAVLLNVSPDHLERHGGLSGYIAAKRQIFKGQGPGKTAVVGVDDEISRGICEELRRDSGNSVVPISGEGPASGGVYALDGRLVDDMDGNGDTVLDLTDAPRLPGGHNAQNAAAAYAACRAVGLDRATIVNGLMSFPGLPHRQELVSVIEGIAYVNDSKATNAEAAARALACYKRIYWIAGGRAKNSSLEELKPFLSHIAKAFLIGEAQDFFASELGDQIPCQLSGDLEHAVTQASEAARADLATDPEAEGPVVLLSPACASFDQFPDFEVRGDAFRQLVERLAAFRAEAPVGRRRGEVQA